MLQTLEKGMLERAKFLSEQVASDRVFARTAAKELEEVIAHLVDSYDRFHEGRQEFKSYFTRPKHYFVFEFTDCDMERAVEFVEFDSCQEALEWYEERRYTVEGFRFSFYEITKEQYSERYSHPF